jgi:hypothetical protein
METLQVLMMVVTLCSLSNELTNMEPKEVLGITPIVVVPVNRKIIGNHLLYTLKDDGQFF